MIISISERKKKELCDILNYIEVVLSMYIQRLCWLAQVIRMEMDVPAMGVFDEEISERRRRWWLLEEYNDGNCFINLFLI